MVKVSIVLREGDNLVTVSGERLLQQDRLSYTVTWCSYTDSSTDVKYGLKKCIVFRTVSYKGFLPGFQSIIWHY